MLVAGERTRVDYEHGQERWMDVSGGRGPVDCDARVRLPGGASPSFLLWGDDARLRFGGVDGAK